MSVAAGLALSVNALSGWSLLFAKEPASTGDAGQADMDKTVALGPPGKKGPTPPTLRERLLFLVLVLVIVGGGGYLAMNPDLLLTLVGDVPGEMPPPPPPKVAKPTVPAPVPVPVPAPPQPAATPAAPTPAPIPAQPTAMAPTALPAAPAPPPMAAPAAPAAPVPAPAPAVVASIPPPAAPAAPAIPSPKFGEGQQVFVGAPIRLTADSAGAKPGPATAKPGSALKVLDADLHNNAWVYSVRTQQGATGWIAEKNLRAKK